MLINHSDNWQLYDDIYSQYFSIDIKRWMNVTDYKNYWTLYVSIFIDFPQFNCIELHNHKNYITSDLNRMFINGITYEEKIMDPFGYPEYYYKFGTDYSLLRYSKMNNLEEANEILEDAKKIYSWVTHIIDSSRR